MSIKGVERSLSKQVPELCFDNYKKAAWNLDAPSSVARSAYFGLKNFERVDKLIQFLSIEQDVNIYGLSKIIENFDIKY